MTNSYITPANGPGAALLDAAGNRWSITAAGQVAINGVADTLTGAVVQLAYVNGVVWQQNNKPATQKPANLWWGKASPTAAWLPASGTATNPMGSSVPGAPTDVVAVAS
jgi:hypothetical protein